MAEDEKKEPRGTANLIIGRGRGTKGLEQYGGRINEEWMRRLQGNQGAKIYREMSDNDSTIGGILFAIEMLLRNVPWRVEKFSDDALHEDQAMFVETLIDDMDSTWEEFIAEALSMLPYGFAPFEIIFKRRGGPLQKNQAYRSKHSDGLMGWRDLAIRAQSTIDRWEFDDQGDLTGLWQYPPYGTVGATLSEPVFIPIERLLVFKTTSRRGNPEGRSILRNVFVDWFHKKRIAESEAIGAERDLAGMPMFYLPMEWFDTDSPNNAKLNDYKSVIENIRVDEQGGLLVPSLFTETGEREIVFELVGTGARRMMDTDKIIKRYDVSIARSVLADFLMLGHQGVGSYALSDDKTELFSTALGAWLKALASPLNRRALPQLYELNGWDPSECAQLVPGDIEKPDVERFVNAISVLTGSGFLTPGREEDENHLRQWLNMPEVAEGESAPVIPGGGQQDMFGNEDEESEE